MKNTKTVKKDKNFDTVKFLRKVKEKISKETADMSFEELKDYLNKNSKKFRKEQENLPPI